MASPQSIQFTEIAVRGMLIHVFDLPDRRPGAASSSSHPTRWIFQQELEQLLYHEPKPCERSTGALYRLLQRTPEAKGRALFMRDRTPPP